MTAEQEQPALVCTMENIKVEGYNGLTDDAASWVTGSLTLTLLDPAITTKIHITSLKVQLKGACAAKLFLSGNNEEDITLTDYTHLKQSKTLVSPDRGIILKLNALNHTTRSVPFRIPISSQEGGAVYCAPPPSIETVTKDCAYQVEIKYEVTATAKFTAYHPVQYNRYEKEYDEVVTTQKLDHFPLYEKSTIQTMMEDFKSKTWVPFLHHGAPGHVPTTAPNYEETSLTSPSSSPQQLPSFSSSSSSPFSLLKKRMSARLSRLVLKSNVIESPTMKQQTPDGSSGSTTSSPSPLLTATPTSASNRDGCAVANNQSSPPPSPSPSTLIESIYNVELSVVDTVATSSAFINDLDDDPITILPQSSPVGKHVDFSLKLESRLLGRSSSNNNTIDPLLLTFHAVPRSQKRKLKKIKLWIDEEWELKDRFMGRRQLVAWELRESVLGEWWKPRTHSIPLPLSSNQTLDPVTYPFLLDSGGVVSSLKHVVNIRLELDNGAFEVLKTRIVIVPCQRGVELDAIASQFPEILPALPQYHQGNGGDCTGSVGSSNSDNNDDETELNIDVPAHPPLYNE